MQPARVDSLEDWAVNLLSIIYSTRLDKIKHLHLEVQDSLTVIPARREGRNLT